MVWSMSCILADAFLNFQLTDTMLFWDTSCLGLLVLKTGVFSRSMHPDWCFRIAVYGGAQSSGINTYWERVLCIVTDTLVLDARSWMQRAQKKLKISCSARLKQLIIFCCTMLCISAGQNQLPHVTILLSDWLKKISRWERSQQRQKLSLYFYHNRTRLKSALKMFFFHDQFCCQCADGGASQVSLASPNKVRGEAIYYFGGEPSWRNLVLEQVVVGRFKQIGSADLFPQCCTPAYWWHDFISKLRDVEISK